MLVLLFFSVWAYADDSPPFFSQVKSLSLSEGDLQNLEEVALAANQTIVRSRAEIISDRAVLTRQLLLPNVTLKDLEPTVRHSIEAELKIRLAELDRQLKIRRLIGDKRWAKLMELASALKKETSPPDDNSDDVQTSRIVNVLRILGS
jgi:hypothetical protein